MKLTFSPGKVKTRTPVCPNSGASSARIMCNQGSDGCSQKSLRLHTILADKITYIIGLDRVHNCWIRSKKNGGDWNHRRIR